MSLKSLLRAKLARRLDVPEIPVALERVAGLGFNPTTVFDVGAYRGDFARMCLSLWPSVEVACFEALPHKIQELNRLATSNNKVRVFPCLLGAASRANVPLHLLETASSILEEHGAATPVALYDMRTVDAVIAEEGLRPPDLLKLDVQGYELEVLKGSEGALPNVQMILAEVNLLDIYKGAPLLSEIIGWLAERGWAAYDICGLTRRPLDSALWQADFIFVPLESPLRASKRWQ